MILGAPNVLRQCSPCSWVLSQGWKYIYIYPTLTSEELATKALISELNYDWVSQPQEHKGKSPSFWIILDECAHIRIQNLDQPFPATLPVVLLWAVYPHVESTGWWAHFAPGRCPERLIPKNDTGPSATVTTDLFVLVLKWPEAPGHFGHPRAGSPLRRQRPFFVASSDWARKNCCSSSFSPPLPGRWESYYCSKTIRKQIFENNFKKSYQKYENVFYQDRSYSKTQTTKQWRCMMSYCTCSFDFVKYNLSHQNQWRGSGTGVLPKDRKPGTWRYSHRNALDPWWWYCRCLSWRL